MAKKELTISEFREIIREEALKLKKKMVLENEKKNLQNELKKLINESFMGEEIEEGLGSMFGLTDSPENVEGRKKVLLDRVNKLKGMGYTKFASQNVNYDEVGFLKLMDDNGYSGKIQSVQTAATMTYIPGRYGASRLGTSATKINNR